MVLHISRKKEANGDAHFIPNIRIHIYVNKNNSAEIQSLIFQFHSRASQDVQPAFSSHKP